MGAWDHGFGFRAEGLGLGAWDHGLGFRAEGLGFRLRAWDHGLRLRASHAISKKATRALRNWSLLGDETR